MLLLVMIVGVPATAVKLPVHHRLYEQALGIGKMWVTSLL